MYANYTVEDFVTLRKKGKPAALSSPAQQANIYLWLRTQGFGQTLVNGKMLFFRKLNEELRPSSMIAMRYAFLHFLENHDFGAWPDGITRHDLIEWFYATQPPRRSQLFQECLFCELSATEISKLLETNPAGDSVRPEVLMPVAHHVQTEY